MNETLKKTKYYKAASTVTGILTFHKAGTLRRDEIIDELRKNKKDTK